MLVIGLAVNEGLETALDVDGGGGRVDKFGGDEGERGGEPGGDEGEDEVESDGSKEGASKEGSGGPVAARGFGECVGLGGHSTG